MTEHKKLESLLRYVEAAAAAADGSAAAEALPSERYRAQGRAEAFRLCRSLLLRDLAAAAADGAVR